MEKKSGVQENGRSLPSGGGAIRSIGSTFQPNLAMGGGSYKVPLDLPVGPGGFSPKLDLVYNTGFGNGLLGQGWMITLPFVERQRKSPFVPPGEITYTLSGAETLIPTSGGQFVPFISQQLQTFSFDGTQWRSDAPNLVSMRFGSSDNSCIAGTVDGAQRVHRWLLDRVTHPGNRHVEFTYDADGAQRYLRRVSWGTFRLEFEYENRPDPFSQFDVGFELRTARRLARIVLHNDRLAPQTQMRTYRFEYQAAEHTRASLLNRILVSGWRFSGGALQETAMPPLTFGYTRFDPGARQIQKFASSSVPPPSLGDDVTLLDFQGTGLPGVLRMNGIEATYWENRGNLNWGPPQRLRSLPQGVHLGEDRVRFADLTGNGTADLLVADPGPGGYYPNDPERGFTAKRNLPLTPSFSLDEPGSHLLDLDGDGVLDLLVFRNGEPMAFFNQRGQSWRGPVTLPADNLPNFAQNTSRLRFADMNGDGLPDLVLLQSRQIKYWPSLGNGRWGAPRVMAGTPEFIVPEPDEDVYLADVDGNGTADLILVGSNEVSIYLNSGGERFSGPIRLQRTPRFGRGQFLLADITGSGTAGFLWTSEGGSGVAHNYWFLDLLNGVKPYLLATVDNGRGAVTTIEYQTSAFERAADLREGRRWYGYLPFSVHVVKRLTQTDTVTGQTAVTEYRYHDGNYDGRVREYIGFGSVDEMQRATPQEAATLRRYYFHTRGATADDPAFIAGKGQPHRTELIDPASKEIRQADESKWSARQVAATAADRPAYLALETERSSRRFQNTVIYEQEQLAFTHDTIGNVTREHRRGEWRDSGNAPHVDELVIEHSFASQAAVGLTTFPSRLKKLDGAGRLLKHVTFFYDGQAFTGLPFGQVEKGYKTRQREIALTGAAIAAAYGAAPPLLGTLYQIENDPEHGQVYVRNTRAYRVDAAGNQLETLDAYGLSVRMIYDADNLFPVSVAEGGDTPRQLGFDPIAQQLSLMEDINGNITRTEFDGLGNIVAVYRRGAQAGLPTETYERQQNIIPNRVITRVRINPNDAAPGFVKHEFYDGGGRICQTRTLSEDGRWAVSKQETQSISNRRVIERDAYFSVSSNFEPAPPQGTLGRKFFYDFAGRLIEETLFNGGTTRYQYVGSETRFLAPDAAAALANNPATPPTRISRSDAWNRVVAIIEVDGAKRFEQKREYDALDQLAKITDSMGNVALESVFDLWGNRIRVKSAEAGDNMFIFDASNNEVTRTDADGLTVFSKRDQRGRITEIRNGGPTGALEERYFYDTGGGANLNGRLSRVEGGFGATDYSYNVEGKPVLIRRAYPGDQRMFELRFTYNNQKDVTSVQYPDGTVVNYQYHPNGMLASIPGFITAIRYGPTGNRDRIVYANGIETRRGYTPADYLLRELITQTADGATRYQHLVHTLDAIGQVTRIDDVSNVAGKIRNNQTFEYDGRNRLTRATGRGAGGDYDHRYRYDDLSNLTFTSESFNEELQYGHQLGDVAHPNRLVKRQSAANAEYLYDASGNMTRDPALGTLTYDTRHRLVRVDRNDGATIEYRYDHNNRRTESRLTKDGVTTVRYEIEGLYLIESTNTTKVVLDEDRRMAVIPQTGDTLINHYDRLGNVNVVSNLTNGRFVGNNEYTAYGQLNVSMAIMPNYSFKGASFDDGLDIVLLGDRYYRPALGRFLTPDGYLLVRQDRIAGWLAATNLYLYTIGNPVNFSDPTGRFFWIVILIVAAIGAVLGLIGAALNGADTWDEWLLWIVGGAIGAVLTFLTYGAAGYLIGGAFGAIYGAVIGLMVYVGASLLGSILCPILDDTNSEVAWFFSFLIKWVQSPITTTVGLIAALIVAIAGGDVDFRRGMLFIEVGSGGGALTLGAVAWTQSGRFDASGHVSDDLARHESFHSRTVVAIGELGFYATYVTIGAIWGVAEGGSWNDLNSMGCGNPFEKTAHTFTGDPATAIATHNC